MDQRLLVAPGEGETRRLLSLLDGDPALRPSAALWVADDTREAWRLWIVPNVRTNDVRADYMRLVRVISAHRNDLANIDAGDIEFVDPEHPLIRGLSEFPRANRDGWRSLSRGVLNGFYHPDSIVVRWPA